jgi:hypothetical protein
MYASIIRKKHIWHAQNVHLTRTTRMSYSTVIVWSTPWIWLIVYLSKRQKSNVCTRPGSSYILFTVPNPAVILGSNFVKSNFHKFPNQIRRVHKLACSRSRQSFNLKILAKSLLLLLLETCCRFHVMYTHSIWYILRRLDMYVWCVFSCTVTVQSATCLQCIKNTYRTDLQRIYICS